MAYWAEQEKDSDKLWLAAYLYYVVNIVTSFSQILFLVCFTKKPILYLVYTLVILKSQLFLQ